MFRKYMFQPIHLADLVDELNLDKAIRKWRYTRKSATKKEKNVRICGFIFFKSNIINRKRRILYLRISFILTNIQHEPSNTK